MTQETQQRHLNLLRNRPKTINQPKQKKAPLMSLRIFQVVLLLVLQSQALAAGVPC